MDSIQPRYTPKYYDSLEERSRPSAEQIAPLVVDLIHPASVIDVGCGSGVWLSVFAGHGVTDVWGMDGAWVEPESLRIPPDKFRSVDLTAPFRMDRQFDLVVSLEVAEHLPGECAATFVKSLTALAPVVLFSAAIPFQGGEHHVNEQWPDYWVKRFEDNGYVAIDWIRPRVWQKKEVAWYYAQNMLMYARREYVAAHETLKLLAEQTRHSQLALVHPRKLERVMNKMGSTAAWWIDWLERDIKAGIPEGETFILIDEGYFGPRLGTDRRLVRFCDGDEMSGRPPDDAGAIQELERLRQTGARFLTLAWPCFWWLDYYEEFAGHLRSKFRCLSSTEQAQIFDLSD